VICRINRKGSAGITVAPLSLAGEKTIENISNVIIDEEYRHFCG
jgi:hypothetical protein